MSEYAAGKNIRIEKLEIGGSHNVESGRGKCDADSPCSTTLSVGKNSAFCCDIEWAGNRTGQ